MNEDQVEGRVNKVAGRVQDAAGALIGNSEQQVKGKARAASGDLQAKGGDFVSGLRDWAATSPISAIALSAGVAFLLGRMTANRD